MAESSLRPSLSLGGSSFSAKVRAAEGGGAVGAAGAGATGAGTCSTIIGLRRMLKAAAPTAITSAAARTMSA